MRLLLLLLFLCVTANAADNDFNDFVRQTVYPSVYSVYEQKRDGGYNMLCSATAFESKAEKDSSRKKVRFASAGHCLRSLDPLAKMMGAVEVQTSYFLGRDDVDDEKVYHRAKVVGKGSLAKGKDFVVFEVETQAVIPVVPLGEDPPDAIDQPVVNVANPLGIGTQVFHGHISRVFLDRHVGPLGSDWHGNLLIQMHGVNGGSSGSAVVCRRQQAICGFVVGTVSGTTVVATRVSQFKSWYADMEKPRFSFGFEDLRKSFDEDELKPIEPSPKPKLRERLEKATDVPMIRKLVLAIILWLCILTMGLLWSRIKRTRQRKS